MRLTCTLPTITVLLYRSVPDKSGSNYTKKLFSKCIPCVLTLILLHCRCKYIIADPYPLFQSYVNGLFSWRFSIRRFIHSLSSYDLPTCLAYFSILYFITLTVLNYEFKSWSSSLSDLLHFCITRVHFFFVPNILLTENFVLKHIKLRQKIKLQFYIF
jgi:hypothetical protein